MRRRLLFVMLGLLMSISCINAQDKNLSKLIKMLQDKDNITSFQKFEETLGNQIKYQVYKLPGGVITATAGVGDIFAEIRHYSKSNNCFLELSEKKTSSKCYIDYNDLLEVNKYLPILIAEAPLDCQKLPDYLENYYKTKDNFGIGYFIATNKVTWFVQMGRYHDVLTIENIADMSNLLQKAQLKIELLMSQN